MRKIILLSLLSISSLISFTVHAKTLKANCESVDGNSIFLEAELPNVQSSLEIQELTVNDEPQENFRDVSKDPVYSDRNFRITITFGSNLYNKIDLNLNRCDDSFEANGTGVLSLYVGGFAGTLPSKLKCGCSFQ